ncbi:MAG TPA: hypothetical protein PKE00_08665 [Planctomycetota bacterium]|nr:hypothetical protein [Planctomycetota bacterium]
MTPSAFTNLPGVVEFREYRGRDARVPMLLLEVPHGATRALHYDALRAELVGSYPSDLRDFFFVNTDVGAPELAIAIAEASVAIDPRAYVVVARCLVPRTFVDCNRVIDASLSGAAGAVTPGLHDYVRDARDRELLLRRHAAYVESVEAAYERILGASGLAMMVHTYAPRSLDVVVDERIVDRLRAEYQSERIGSWPLRPDVDLIADDAAGRRLASPDLVAALQTAGGKLGYEVASSSTYHLHDATYAARFAQRYEGRTLCFEVRRDHLVREFTPFDEMHADPERVASLARAIAEALPRCGCAA